MTDNTNSYKGKELAANQALLNITHSYKGLELTELQAFVVGNFTRRLKTSRAHQLDLEQRLEAARGALVLGKFVRRERGLTEDQDTEWEYPCGKSRLEQLAEAVFGLRAEIRNCDTGISQDTFKLQSYLDSLSPPTAVPASEAPNACDEDVASPCTTCCPGGEQDTTDSSSSDDEDDDDE